MVLLRLGAAAALAALVAACAAPAVQTPPELVRSSPSLPVAAPTATAGATEIAEETTHATEFAKHLAILSPGSGSQLISPIHVELAVPAGGAVRIELYRGDGRLIARQLLPPPSGGLLHLQIPFEVGAAQPGLLTVSQGDEAGRLARLVSADVLLLAEGAAAIQPAGEAGGLLILSPEAGSQHSGGPLLVSGRLLPGGTGPLQARLLNEAGQAVAAADPRAAEDGSFEFLLSYAPRQAGWFLLTVAQQQQGVLINLASVEVWLEP